MKIQFSEIAKGKQLYYFQNAASNIDFDDNSKTHSYHGAVMVSGGKIIGNGTNTQRSRLKGVNMWSVHAEVDSIFDYYSRRRVLRKKKGEKGSKGNKGSRYLRC